VDEKRHRHPEQHDDNDSEFSHVTLLHR